MASGNRCYLCGGKLRRGRCVECGLDNDRMTRRDYRLNVTTPYHVKKQQVAARKAENMKYAKVYEVRQESLENMGKPINQQKKTSPPRPINTPTKSNTGRTVYQKQASEAYRKLQRETRSRVERRQQEVNDSKKKWKGLSIAGIIWIIFLVISEVGGCVSDIIDEFSYKTPEYESVYYEEEVAPEPNGAVPQEDYEYVSRELSETGDYYESVLTPGYYIVGVHIPEGCYTLEIIEGTYMSSYIQDFDNGIYLSPGFGEDSYDGYLTLEDVRLYEGALVEINGSGALNFTSENAQTDTMTGMENPMDPTTVATFETDEYMEIVVGEDIPEGVYDFTALSGWSSVNISYNLDEESCNEYYYWIDSETLENTFANIVLIEGMTIICDNAIELQITPSAAIATDDYETLFFDYYY